MYVGKKKRKKRIGELFLQKKEVGSQGEEGPAGGETRRGTCLFVEYFPRSL